jgi:hypothetical protein
LQLSYPLKYSRPKTIKLDTISVLYAAIDI